MQPGHDTRQTQRKLEGFGCRYFDLGALEAAWVARLPRSLKVLLENLLRFEDNDTVRTSDIDAFGKWMEKGTLASQEIAFRPARVLMQDFTGVPAVVDLASMRDAITRLGRQSSAVNPQIPVDLVIDHSVMVDYFARPDALQRNVGMEYKRNRERYAFLKWGQHAFKNFRVVPPGTGICHQVNLEYLAQVAWLGGGSAQDPFVYPDTLVGTDSHTTMVNALGVLGWGVGGIEAEAAMLGQPISMLLPDVVGVRIKGRPKEGITATDIVLTLTQQLRKLGVVGKFVEFFGDGLDALSLEDRATISNMAPEYGATCAFFCVDNETLRYLRATGREPQRIALVEAYCKKQGLWREKGETPPVFSQIAELDLGEVTTSLAGPKRPQDRLELGEVKDGFARALKDEYAIKDDTDKRYTVPGKPYDLGHGDVVIAAITSCTNTSNPSLLIAAGLVARKARARGLGVKPWVKTSFAPGSKVVTDYLGKSGLQEDLDALGFSLVGYGCTTCIGNSGPLPGPIAETVRHNRLAVASVLSGNRNFEGRISSDVMANFLASPPLVVAYAITGSMRVDLSSQPLSIDGEGKPVYLADIWPESKEIAAVLRECVSEKMFARRYADVFKGDESWANIDVPRSPTYDWPESTYVANPPYFEGITQELPGLEPVKDAHILGLLGDSITTDHISPAGGFGAQSAAGRYLEEQGVAPRDFNSYGARRGNHHVMMRGTFANIRLRNFALEDKQGGYARHVPSGEVMTFFDAAARYKSENIPLVIFAGAQYGTGSSRDWAAKGTRLLGVKAVIASSFERIHRSNLVGMAVLPLQFESDVSWRDLGLKGDEKVSLALQQEDISPGMKVTAQIVFPGGKNENVDLTLRVDTDNEMAYMRHAGILPYVVRKMAV